MDSNYNDNLKQNMVDLYNSLSEKDRRRYAAVEAIKLGYGGISYIAALFSCDEKTISKGINELNNQDSMSQETIRSVGGGRKSKIDQVKNINTIFLEVLKDYTAGNPMKEDVKWTNLTKARIQEEMAKKGIHISRNIIKKLLKKTILSNENHKKRNRQDTIKIATHNSIK